MCYNVFIINKGAIVINTENMQKTDSVCFTGHRSIDPSHAVMIPPLLEQLLRTLIKHGIINFYAGGAIGFDTVAAITVLKLKKEFPHINLNLILPCKTQSKPWNEGDRKIYESILLKADNVEYVCESYTSTCMHMRNRRLVECADICIAYCVHSGGGSAYTVTYALNNKKEVINLSDFM